MAGLLAVIIRSAPDVVVDDGLLSGGFGQLPAVQPLFEDRLDTLVTVSLDRERPGAGGFQALGAVTLGEPHDAQAGPEALFGMSAMLHDGGNQVLSIGADLSRPADQARRSPLKIFSVAPGHMVLCGRVLSPLRTARMSGDAAVLEQDLDHARGEADIDLPSDELIGDAVVVAVDLDVVVDIDRCLLPFRVFIGMERQRLQGGLVDRFKEDSAGRVQLLELAVIELGELLRDCFVQLREAEEGMVPKRSGDPALGDQHRRFHLGLVFRPGDPGGDDDRSIVPGHIVIGRIDIGFVPAGAGDPGLQVVRHDDLRDAAEELKRPDVRGYPGRQILRKTRFDIGIVAGSQGGDEEIGVPGCAGERIRDRHRLPGIIDEEFLSGPVGLPEAYIEPGRPLPVAVAELAVLKTVGMGLLVLVPEKLEGHALSLQLLVEVLEGRHLPLIGRDITQWRIQQLLQRGVIEIFGKRPSESRPLRPVQVIPYGAAGD